MFTDAHPFKEVDGCFYEVECRVVVETVVHQSDESIAGNLSAEDQGVAGSDDHVQTVINVVTANRLQEAQGFTKEDYKAHIKIYIHKLFPSFINQARRSGNIQG